ncbi:origin recognition complex subunit 4 C-terminus-domain-containing protein [Aspergillus unguis]
MKDPRTAKRRRVSDASVDEDGDVDMADTQRDVSPTPTKPVNSGVDTPTDTPSRAGLRSSGRQRKAPQRYEDQVEVARTASVRRANSRRTPRGTPKAAPPETETAETAGTMDADADSDAYMETTPTRSVKSARQSQARRQISPDIETDDEDYKDDGEDQDDDEEIDGEEEEEEDYGPPRSRAKRTTSTRTKTKAKSNRASVRFAANENENSNNGGAAVTATANGNANELRESPVDDYADGLDDLVAMQLQQGLVPGASKDETVADSTPQEELPAYAEQFQQIVRKGDGKEVQLLTKLIVEKLNGKRLVSLKGLESEYHKVHQLIEQTVTVGEGNSMLVLGSRGAGKTAIIETAVSSLAKEHRNDFHVVRLNGFLHTDDRLALREIWRQLGRETETEEEAGKVTSYADTMATLLALLSHPEELHGTSNQDGATTAKSIVIVLDEFDLFVTHPRQTLLYNLFDIAQARKAPLAVLGVTTKVDVTEMLEKRVKSRFSHRSVYVPLPRTFEIFSEACHAGLDLDLEDKSELDAFKLNADEQLIVKSNSWREALDGWRGYLQGLWADPAFQTHLRRIYHQTKSVKEFFTSALIPVTELYHTSGSSSSQDTIQIPTPNTFTTHTLSCPDPSPLPFTPASSTSSSSSLPLSLLLAATRLTALYDPSAEGIAPQDLAPLALSFPAAYAEYVRLLTTAKTSASVSGATVTPGRVWGRDVAREAWERLVAWGLVSPVGGGSGTADGRMFRVEIAYEEVAGLVEGVSSGGGLGRWWRDA